MPRISGTSAGAVAGAAGAAGGAASSTAGALGGVAAVVVSVAAIAVGVGVSMSGNRGQSAPIEYCLGTFNYDIYRGRMSISYLGADETLSQDEALSLARLFNSTYSEVVGSCDDEFSRLLLDVRVGCDTVNDTEEPVQCCRLVDTEYGQALECLFDALVHCTWNE